MRNKVFPRTYVYKTMRADRWMQWIIIKFFFSLFLFVAQNFWWTIMHAGVIKHLDFPPHLTFHIKILLFPLKSPHIVVTRPAHTVCSNFIWKIIIKRQRNGIHSQKNNLHSTHTHNKTTKANEVNRNVNRRHMYTCICATYLQRSNFLVRIRCTMWAIRMYRVYLCVCNKNRIFWEIFKWVAQDTERKFLTKQQQQQ